MTSRHVSMVSFYKIPCATQRWLSKNDRLALNNAAARGLANRLLPAHRRQRRLTHASFQRRVTLVTDHGKAVSLAVEPPKLTFPKPRVGQQKVKPPQTTNPWRNVKRLKQNLCGRFTPSVQTSGDTLARLTRILAAPPGSRSPSASCRREPGGTAFEASWLLQGPPCKKLFTFWGLGGKPNLTSQKVKV